MTKQEAIDYLKDYIAPPRIGSKYVGNGLLESVEIAIECIEKCEHLVGDTLEIVGEYVDDCICVYDFEIFGRNVPMIPVETVHQLLERIGEEAKGSGDE